jgi:hypothetical protein
VKTTLTVRVELNDEALQGLNRAVKGSAGFQSLLRMLQNQLAGNTLVLTPELVVKIARYVQNYGKGGFQGRLDGVLVALTQLARALEPLAA